MMVRKGLMGLAALGVALSLAACGVKSSPQYPKDSDYPHPYPTAGEQTKASSQTTIPGTDPAKETKDGARSPLGFPLEYPNRPSYN
jgi:hypothetical protein